MKEIDRPLGLDRPSARSSRLSLPAAGQLVGWAFMLAVVGGSTAIAFRERPFRAPAVVVTSTPQQAADPSDAPATAPAEGGAKILKAPLGAAGPAPLESPSPSVIVVRDPSEVGQDLRVAHLPDRDLVEEAAEGLLPVRGADGRRPFDVYATPWSGARGARVAIVIGGLGLSQTGTQQAIAALPPQVTLAFAPQGNSLDRWMQTARREGHEIVLQAPMEPYDYPSVDPGRNTLTVDAKGGENAERLRWMLGRTTNYVGIMNYMGARFLGDRPAMDALMRELGERGLMFLDDGTTARSAGAELALGHRVPYASGDAVIDANRDRRAILDKLDELERTARAKGFAIGSGSAFDVTVEAVAAWVNEAKKRGIEIVPVSALAADPEKG